MKELPAYTLTIEGDVLCCVDLKTGQSITVGAANVILDLAAHVGETFPNKRVIYRDTTDTWDGLAHRDGRFLAFVPLRTKDRSRALSLAVAGIDKTGRDWPR